MLIDSPELERLGDEVAGITGESRQEALWRALEERRDRSAAHGRPPAIPAHDVEARLAAWRQRREFIALTPDRAEAWIGDLRAERMPHRIPAT